LFTACPNTFVPVDVMVNVFASLDTTKIMVTATCPPCLVTALVVVALIRVKDNHAMSG